MKKKYFDFKIEGNYIIVYYKNKELFKTSNSVHNAASLHHMLED